jgi:hypothetical protein
MLAGWRAERAGFRHETGDQVAIERLLAAHGPALLEPAEAAALIGARPAPGRGRAGLRRGVGGCPRSPAAGQLMEEEDDGRGRAQADQDPAR